MYPPDCCAVGTLHIFSPEPLPREVLEICGTPERWSTTNDKWVPLTASYVAFSDGDKLPDAPEVLYPFVHTVASETLCWDTPTGAPHRERGVSSGLESTWRKDCARRGTRH